MLVNFRMTFKICYKIYLKMHDNRIESDHIFIDKRTRIYKVLRKYLLCQRSSNPHGRSYLSKLSPRSEKKRIHHREFEICFLSNSLCHIPSRRAYTRNSTRIETRKALLWRLAGYSVFLSFSQSGNSSFIRELQLRWRVFGLQTFWRDQNFSESIVFQ